SSRSAASMNPRRLRIPVSASVAAAAEIATNSRSRRRARRLERSASAAKASAMANAAPRAIHTRVGMTLTNWVMYLTLEAIGEVRDDPPDGAGLCVLGLAADPVCAAAVPVGAAATAVPAAGAA